MVASARLLQFARRMALPLVGAVLLQSCAPSTLFLKKDQYLFTQARIKGAKHLDPEILASLQQQKPNRRIFYSTPYLWFYQLGERFYHKQREKALYDSLQKTYNAELAALGDPNSKSAIKWRNKQESRLERHRLRAEQGNWLMRTVGEPPSIFDSAALHETQRQMKSYLFNKGFFLGTVATKVDTNRRAVRVVFTVNEGPDRQIRHVRYHAYDPFLQHIVDSITHSGRRIDSGDRYDQDLIIAERERLDKALHNCGYFAFTRDRIFTDADTSAMDTLNRRHLIDLLYEIKDPKEGLHQQYVIDNEEFHIQRANADEPSDSTIRPYNGITYYTPYRHLSYRTLDTKVLVRAGQLYNAERLTLSQAQLQSMDIFRFVNFIYDSIPGNPHRFKLKIETTRLPKYQISNEVGLLISQGAPGPFINEGFKVRNALNSFDIFELSARYSQEGQISVFNQLGSVYRAKEFGVTAALTFPAITLPGYTSYLFRAKSPKTRLSVGYTNVVRPEYSQNVFKGTYGYSINLSNRKQLGVNLIDVSYVRTPDISLKYDTFLTAQKAAGNPLYRSFSNQIVTSFSSFYVFNSASQTAKIKGQFFRVFGEIGGFIPNAFAQSLVIVDDKTKLPVDSGRFILRGNDNQVNLRVFRFAKLQLDYRYYIPANKTTLWAFRVNTGIAVPIGDSRGLPYVKYFFSGGSNSIRAWAPRRLGPGTYNTYDTTKGGKSNPVEQPGEIIIEANVELRSKLFSIFEGALFADLGNVFTLQNETGRPGSQFKLNQLYKTLALGVGPGLRMNFSFLVVRLDAGIKAYDPSAPEGVTWVIKDIFHKPPSNYSRYVLNIGIGYPF